MINHMARMPIISIYCSKLKSHHGFNCCKYLFQGTEEDLFPNLELVVKDELNSPISSGSNRLVGETIKFVCSFSKLDLSLPEYFYKISLYSESRIGGSWLYEVSSTLSTYC